jgi:hypothetical protein
MGKSTTALVRVPAKERQRYFDARYVAAGWASLIDIPYD